MTSKRKKWLQVATVAVLLLAVVVVVVVVCSMLGLSDSAQQGDAEEYCRQVHNKAWPDFNKNYLRQCNADGTVNEDYLEGN
jgi:negative regulator of sigma E activity